MKLIDLLRDTFDAGEEYGYNDPLGIDPLNFKEWYKENQELIQNYTMDYTAAVCSEFQKELEKMKLEKHSK